MFNGLAEKLFGIVSTTSSTKCDEDDQVLQQGSGDESFVAASASQKDDKSDDEEWVLIDDKESSDRSSTSDELELLSGFGCASPITVDRASAALPPPSFAAKLRGRNKYKNSTKHRNPNLNKSVQQKLFYPAGKTKVKKVPSPPPRSTDMELNAYGDPAAITLTRPDGVSTGHKQDASVVKDKVLTPIIPVSQIVTFDRPKPPTNKRPDRELVPKPVNQHKQSQGRSKVDNKSGNPGDENQPPQLPVVCGKDDALRDNNDLVVQPRPGEQRVASKSNFTYVLTGLQICNAFGGTRLPRHAGGVAAVTGETLQFLQYAGSANSGGSRRWKRQSLAHYDPRLFSAAGKAKQRKSRIKNFSGRSNDRRRQ